jgi:hypothetical protein
VETKRGEKKRNEKKGILEPWGSIRELFWDAWGLFVGVMGANFWSFWEILGARKWVLRPLGALGRILGISWGSLGGLLEIFGSIFGVCWRLLGVFWGSLGLSWVVWGGISGSIWSKNAFQEQFVLGKYQKVKISVSLQRGGQK